MPPIWGRTWLPLLEADRIDIGQTSLGLARLGHTHRKRLCHGADFPVVASKQKFTEFEKLWESRLDVRMTSDIIGFGECLGKPLKTSAGPSA